MPTRTSSARTRTIQSIAHGASSHVCVITFRVSAAAGGRFSLGGGLPSRSSDAPISRAVAASILLVSWVFLGLLAGAVIVLIAAEWPRLSDRLGIGERMEARERRSRAERKSKLRVVRDESEEFEASVRRDLDRLPTIEKKRDPRR
jgi:hypothetical protein